jgi:hypothetical protein
MTNNQNSIQLKQLEEEIKMLRTELKKIHFAKSSEQDYDIKSQIIDKQNEMIELLIKQSEEKNEK